MCRNTKNSNTNQKKKNKDNNGILIDGEEYRRKQYPNECSIILDSSSISRDGIIKHWKYFAKISVSSIYIQNGLDR